MKPKEVQYNTRYRHDVNGKHAVMIYTRNNKSPAKQWIWSTMYTSREAPSVKKQVIHAQQHMHNDKGSGHAASTGELVKTGSYTIIDALCTVLHIGHK